MLHPRKYEAVRGDSRIVGTARELADKLGVHLHTIYGAATLGKPACQDWKVRRIGTKRHIYFAYYRMDETKEDPVVGTADEIAEVLGISDAAVYRVARERSCTRGGWIIEEARTE